MSVNELMQSFENVTNIVKDAAIKKGEKNERTRIISLIDQLIHDTEACPLYEGGERLWLLSAYWNVRRLVVGEKE